MPDAIGRSVPNALAARMQPFRSTFTAPTWRHVLVLVMGAILVPGRRTVASALRVMGLEQVARFSNYHRVLNRNVWSSRWLSRRLFRLLVDTFVPGDNPVGHRQLIVDGIAKGAMGWMTTIDRRDYAAVATPVTSAHLVNA